MDDRQIYKEKAQAKLDELSARIDVLKAQANQHKADAKLATNRELEQLRERRENLRTHMSKLSEAGSDAWTELRVGFDRALADVQEALDKAGRELHKQR
jgi:hypothetical protein